MQRRYRYAAALRHLTHREFAAGTFRRCSIDHDSSRSVTSSNIEVQRSAPRFQPGACTLLVSRLRAQMPDRLICAHRSMQSRPMSNDIALWSTTRQAEAIRRREISSRGLLEHTIMRIERINPALECDRHDRLRRRARGRRSRRFGVGARRRSRSAARSADHHQRRARDEGHSFHRRRDRTAQQHPDARCTGGTRGESRWRHRHRQDQLCRAGRATCRRSTRCSARR